MTNLMQQLQAWANDGRYNFEHDVFSWLGIDIVNPDWIDWMTLVKLVIDGTIPVWRPVEHYPPPESGEVLALFRYGVVDEYEVVEVGDLENEDHFTHWQPLPKMELVARLKGGVTKRRTYTYRELKEYIAKNPRLKARLTGSQNDE